MDHTVKLTEKERRLLEDDELPLLQYFLNRKIKIDHECGGMGICGTCRVEVLNAPQKLPELNEFEKLRLDEFACSNNERLSCQLPAIDDLKVRIPR